MENTGGTFNLSSPLSANITPSSDHDPVTGPINLVLCLFVFLQNPMIIWHYYPERGRLSALLFILIAVADLVLACTETVDAAIGIACMHGYTLPFPPVISIGLAYPSMFCYECSVFYNMILAVVKTISIMNPFHRISQRLVYTTLLAGTVFWAGLCVGDCILAGLSVHSHESLFASSCEYFWDSMTSPNLGGIFLDFILKTDEAWILWLMFPINLAPNITIFICMCLQVRYIKKNIGGSDALIAEANHAVVTVILISVLFMVCNLKIIAYDTPQLKKKQFPLPCFMLVNAAIYPVILILRSQSLRDALRIRRFKIGIKRSSVTTVTTGVSDRTVQ